MLLRQMVRASDMETSRSPCTMPSDPLPLEIGGACCTRCWILIRRRGHLQGLWVRSAALSQCKRLLILQCYGCCRTEIGARKAELALPV